jgi:tetratricopeptide (TPR) repeat protein
MRRATWGLVVAGLTALSAGCVKDQTTTGVLPPPRPDQITKEDPGPPRAPKADTCVAAGVWFENSGDSAKIDEKKRLCFQKARTAYEQALSLEPQNRAALLAVARLAEKEGNPAAAGDLFDKAVRQLPLDAGLWYETGMFWARQKNWDRATACVGRATELDPTNNQFATTLGWTLARAERYDDSFRVFSRLVGEAQAYAKLASMATHLGRRDLGRQYAEEALKADPQLREAREVLARLDAPPADAAVQQAGHTAPAPAN